MDVAPIAEEFFTRLLHETDPIEAIRVLSARWGVRARRTEPWLGLSKPEYAVTMVLRYVGEVGNGGHVQFFSNWGGESATRAREALGEVGLDELERILGDACALFPGSQVPADRGEVELLIGTWREGQLTEVDRLDRQVWSLDVCPRLLAYVRQHQGEILRPERGRI